MGFATLALAASLKPSILAADDQQPAFKPAAGSASPEQELRRQALEHFRAAGQTGAPAQTTALLMQKNSGGFNCLPTCNTLQPPAAAFGDPGFIDGKWLAIAGDGLVTLSDLLLEVRIAVPAETGGVPTTSFVLGVFDGDAGRGG
ncbi:MAG: hypothetical protein D6696_02530, partial [Acidobacteria bacterium]